MTSFRRVAVALVAVTLGWSTVAGCDETDPGKKGNPGPQRVAELENQLRAKPSFEQAHDEYRSAMTQMANQIVGLVPGMTWHVEEDSWGACAGELVWTHAVHVYYFIVFDRPIPDAVWPRAVDVVKAGVSRFGATNVQVLVDKPGNKEIALAGPDGVGFKFGTAAQTIFSATSDCRMRATAAPTPP